VSRYIDEMNLALPVAGDAFWVRDAFVAPAWRGRRVFAALVATIATEHVVPCRSVWSDVDWVNAPSMHAHRSAGFEVWTRLRALEFFGRLRLRGAAPAWDPPPYDVALGKRIVWLGGSTLRRHAALIA
jgi:GNAT superfamily N-acetyltransferase